MLVITFDQPLWVRPVSIAKETQIDTACRLGGLYTLISLVGSIEVMIVGSGLKYIN